MKIYIKLLSIATIVLLFTACTSTQTPQKEQKTAETNNIESQTQEDVLSEIQVLAAEFYRHQNVERLNIDLLNLADKSINQQNCNKANIIIKHIQPSLSENLRQVATLFKTECNLVTLNSLPKTVNKAPLIKQTEQWLSSINTQALLSFESSNSLTNLTERKMIARAKFNAKTGQHAVAINQLLNLVDSERFFDKSYFGNELWEWFTLLDTDSRAALATRFPSLKNYKILIDTVEDESINDTMRKVVINNWIVKEQILEQDLPRQIIDYLALSTENIQKIAVLLPLSGRLSNQGDAMRHGLLSAYFNKIDNFNVNNHGYEASIDFIDTGSFDSIKPDITAERLFAYDTIIGPLLSSHVNQINSMFLQNKKQLLLNRGTILNSNFKNDSNLVATFSLSPEQEASQIVYLMREQNVRNPVLVSDSSNVSNRMVEAFIDAWQASKLITQDYIAPQIVSYTDNKGMKVGITSALDVLQSEKRIQQLSNLTQDRVVSVTRNRRDIDSFVVFARPDDVELINPIIESSISLFSNKQIPVFASSYGYDHKQNRNTQRDLRNLVFIDMPWLLPSKRNSELALEIDQQFNDPPSMFLRLFAFGFDSLSVAENLSKLTTFRHIQHDGLSGRLSSNEDNQFIRQLDYIEITNN